MINMIVLLDKHTNEDSIQDILDIILTKYQDSADLVFSVKDESYITKKLLKKKYKEFIKSTPKEILNDYGISSFDDYIFEYWNILGFVGDCPIFSYNTEVLFEYFEIDDVFRKYEVDEFDIVDNIDYLLDKDGTLYELENINSTPKGFVRILQECDYNDFVVIISGQD